MPGSPGQVYAARAEAFRTEALDLTARFNRIANLRLVAFVASVACLIWGFSQAQAQTQTAPVALVAGLVLAGAFVALVRYHRRLGLRRAGLGFQRQ